MSGENPRPDDVPLLPAGGPGFWVPALVLPLLLLGAAVAVFILGSGLGATIIGGALILGAVSAAAFYASRIRRGRVRRNKH